MKLIEYKNKKYIIHSDNNGYTQVKELNNGFKSVLQFHQGYELCSNLVIQGLYFSLNTPNDLFKEVLDSYKKTVISIQNVTKQDYNRLLKCGFIDLYRLPGTYTIGYNKPYSNTSECLSIMVYPYKDIKKSLNTSLELIKKYLNIEQKKEIQKEIKQDNLYFCVNPTTTLTKSKLYTAEKVIGNYIKVKNDNNITVKVNINKFEKVTI